MTPDRWRRLQDLFDATLALAPEERSAYMALACGGDATLKCQLEALVASGELTDDDLGGAVADAALRMFSAAMPGERIGPYRILNLIGRGGMGAVYLAERDDEYRQQVAIKVVAPDCAGNSEAIVRFRAERQILANLNHPYIARLLDGGVTGNLPWLAMEFVDGTPIDTFCTANKLGPREKVSLLRKVCEAVEHAHQNLVVHRDLKPGNVLITAAGEPKLLDFGIAKLLEGDYGQLTRASERLLTPDYASPEQVRGEAVTTATDVYALGILLYELITGRRPYNSSTLSPLDLQNAICTTEPPRPATILKLDTDLEQIILKAMRKEPPMRYASVAALNEDLGRYLDGYPVRARQGSWRYRSVKFARRHRAAIAVAFLLVSALAWGGVSTRIAQARAERRFKEVRELSGKFIFEFHDAIADLPGATRARSLLVTRALEYLDRLAAEHAGDVSLQDELATAYERVRDIQSNVRSGSVGDIQGALRSGGKALRLRDEVFRARPDQTSRIKFGLAYLHLGEVESETRDLETSLAHLARATELLSPAAAADPRDSNAVSSLLVAYKDMGEIHRMRGEPDSALANLQLSLKMAKQLAAADPDPRQKPVNLQNVASAQISIGDLYRIVKGDLPKAEACYRDAIAVEETRFPLEPDSALAQREVALAHERLGLTMTLEGRPAEAQPHLEQALRVSESLSQADPASAMHRRQLSVEQINLGSCLLAQKKTVEAIRLYSDALAIRLKLFENDKTSVETREDLSWAWYRLGTAQAASLDHASAQRSFARAIDLRAPLVAEYPDRIETAARLAKTYLAAEQSAVRDGQCARARDCRDKARGIYARLKSMGKLEGLDLADAAKLEEAISACRAN
jgi:eukaryotic-like serine/threonine-protein kinase